jgi:hypothetical protein
VIGQPAFQEFVVATPLQQLGAFFVFRDFGDGTILYRHRIQGQRNKPVTSGKRAPTFDARQGYRTWVSVHGARVTAVQSGLGIGTATRQPWWPSGTQVDAPASMRTTPGLGDDFLHESLPPQRGHTRRDDKMRRRIGPEQVAQIDLRAAVEVADAQPRGSPCGGFWPHGVERLTLPAR